MKVPIGKLPPRVLENLVLSRLGVIDVSVLLGPRVGEDAAIIDIGDDKVLAIHVDPITEALERIGWLGIHVASNDIAVRGVRPRWFLSTILLPQDEALEALDAIMKQMDAALKEVGGMLIGGHTEVSPGVEKPIVVVTALGVGAREKVVLTGGAMPGDYVIMTKAAGLEGTAIIASDFREKLLSLGIPQGLIDEAISFFNEVSVVKEALALAEVRATTAMHDPTEGGLLNGLLEITMASRCIIEVFEDKIPVRAPTRTICRALGLDPFKLISSGVLVATVRPSLLDVALRVLKNVEVDSSVIGRVVDRGDPRLILHRASGEVEEISECPRDEISKLWSLE
jgi:hydrogenase maturation factor